MSQATKTIPQLLNYAKPATWLLIGSALARTLHALLTQALFAFPVWALLDFAISGEGSWLSYLSGGTNRFAQLAIVAGITLAIGVLRGVCYYLEHFLGHLVAFRLLAEIRVDVYDSLAKGAPASVTGINSGKLLAQVMRGVDQIEVFFAHTIAPMITLVVVPAVTAVVLVSLGYWQLALLTLGYILIGGLLLPIAGSSLQLKYTAKTQAERGELSQSLTDMLLGWREIRGFRAADRMLSRLTKLTQNIRKQNQKVSLLLRIREALALLLDYSFWALAALIVFSMPSSALPVGLGCWSALFALRQIVSGVQAAFKSLDQALSSAEQITNIKTAPEISPDVLGASSAKLSGSGLSICLKDASFEVPGGSQKIIDSVSLDIPAGSWFALVGASGSGKSTIGRLICRWWPLNSGSILVAGQDVNNWTRTSLEAAAVYVPQRPNLFSMSIRDNLKLAKPDADDTKLFQVLETVDLAEIVQNLPNGLDTRMGARSFSFSIGQAQRFAVARALLAEPEMLVLDEVTSHQDPEHQDALLANLRAIPNTTVLFITHRLENLQPTDRVAVLDSGRITAEGTAAELGLVGLRYRS